MAAAQTGSSLPGHTELDAYSEGAIDTEGTFQQSNRGTQRMKPYFVVIEDSTSTEVVHPEVHYIFSDDDGEVLTNATLDAADNTSSQHNQPEHRVLIVDMAADARTVTKISSLSQRWQVAATEIGQAPSWHGNNETSSKGTMLRISGCGTHPATDPDIPLSTALPELTTMLGQELRSLELHLDQYTGDGKDIESISKAANSGM